MEYLCVDVETANEAHSSICQVGIASFVDGCYVDGISSFVNPEDEFLDINVGIHGITPDSVANSPTFQQIYPLIQKALDGKVVVSHTPFDRISLERACAAIKHPPISCRWLDSARIVRRAYPNERYGLRFIARHLGISFNNHDALEDARCAGEIVARACRDTGLDLEAWFKRVQLPVFLPDSIEANREGPLFGEVIVFTGALAIPRRVAAELSANAGCEVADGITKHTTILVVGNQDARKLNGAEISSKHAKARALVAKGNDLKIISEDDFEALVGLRH